VWGYNSKYTPPENNILNPSYFTFSNLSYGEKSGNSQKYKFRGNCNRMYISKNLKNINRNIKLFVENIEGHMVNYPNIENNI
jgi:hypothetical protein